MQYTRRRFVRGASVAGLGLLAACGPLPGQAPPAKVHRLGWLSNSRVVENDAVVRRRLQDLGYVEGQNLLIEQRESDRPAEQAGGLAAELVALQVETILTTGSFSAEAARAATSTLPIVMVYPGNPVSAGLVSSLARPGGNVTGVTDFQPQLLTKRLELLKEAAPSISRVALPLNPDVPLATMQPGGTLPVAAQTLGLELIVLDVRTPGDLDAALGAATRAGVDAVFWAGGGGNFRSAEFGARLVALSAQYRLPTICGYLEWAQAGVLLAYASNYPAQLRRAVDYVDKIIKGARPADLPVEQPREFEFAINATTAQTLGLIIPQHVLLQATEVVQ